MATLCERIEYIAAAVRAEGRVSLMASRTRQSQRLFDLADLLDDLTDEIDGARFETDDAAPTAPVPLGSSCAGVAVPHRHTSAPNETSQQ